MGSSEKRTRGPNKHAPWQRIADEPVSVLRLPLDATDPVQRARVEAMFACAFQVRRALQHDARDRTDAYWAAKHERNAGAGLVRERLGLSRTDFEHAAYAHLDAAPHLRRFTTKALAMHLADNVWTWAERHLFGDASGRRQGRLHIGRWFDFTRIPGRARSHTRARKWETFRLHGSLAGHRAAYTTIDGDFVQPRHLRHVESDAWWTHEGSLAVVFSGLAGGTLVLPVRLPTAPSNQACLEHHLADPSKWHKIDLVRRPDPHAVGGWRYEAHLMVLAAPYVSPAVADARAKVALATADRQAGIDVNVSNMTVASHASGEDLRITRIVRDETQQRADHRRTRRQRRQQRALERSRRAQNRAQYQLSKRQQKRARRRAAAGLAVQDVIPAGPRKTRSGGVPVQAFRRDQLGTTYRRGRAMLAAEAAAAARARRDHARRVARSIVATHGPALVVEDCAITTWSRSWGRAVAAFSPAMLVDAIEREAALVARRAGAMSSGLLRASTRTTAMSRHCPCGARVDKRLADRSHDCPACGLRGDRDAVAAVLASFVDFDDTKQPTSAFVDYDATRAAHASICGALSVSFLGWQGTPPESNASSARDGSFITWPRWTPDSVVVARQNAWWASSSTPDETDLGQTKSERARTRANMSRYGPNGTLRDNP